jgi:hypothetical protein|tara:strand:+ start:68 stop:532 length:465 start_codon:yes stop_codon:yes gene_type:complete
MANPLYGQNKADGNIGWMQNYGNGIKDHGTLGDNLVLTAYDMVNAVAHTCDPAAARNITTPTAALIVAAMQVKASDGKCIAGDTFQFCFINAGTAGEDESCTMVAGTGVTLVGGVVVENYAATHDAFSSGSGLFAVHVTNATSGSEAVSLIRLA